MVVCMHVTEADSGGLRGPLDVIIRLGARGLVNLEEAAPICTSLPSLV